MNKILLPSLIVCVLMLFGFTIRKKSTNMESKRFIEIVVQNHLISHGFDEDNKEIIEEVLVEKPTKKLLSIDRVQSISEKYILTTYGFGRLVYWEYEGSFDELKAKIQQESGE